MSEHRAVVATFVLCLTGVFFASPLLADEKAAHEFLKSKGLRKVGFYRILPMEKELAEQLKTLAPLKKQHDQAIQRQQAYERYIEGTRKALRTALQERRRLTLMIMQARNKRQLAQIGVRLMELSDRIELLTRTVNDSREANAINRQAAQTSEAYTQKLLDLRTLVDETEARYKALAEDEEVQQVIHELRMATGRRISLGPRRIFTRQVRQLEKLEKDITTANIGLRIDQGVLWVETVLNERVIRSMIFDTGASLVCVPSDLADELNLHPAEDDPVIQMRIADGRTVEGRLMSLDSVRVGTFTAENVDCVVFPPEMANAPPLLGGSFLRHFTYKINHDAGKLTLSKINTSTDKKPRQ